MNTSYTLNKKIKPLILSIALSILVYVGVSIIAGWHDIMSVLTKIGFNGLLIALLLSMLNYLLRFVRWHYYLQHLGFSIPRYSHWQIYLSGFSLTTTPAKAGEIIRSVLLLHYRVPIPSSLAAFVSERLSDLIAILLLSLIGLWDYPTMRLPAFIAGFLLIILWSLIMFKPYIDFLSTYAQKKSGKIRENLQKLLMIIYQVQSCQKIHQLFLTTLISLIAWSMEAWAFYWVLHWCGVDTSWSFAFFCYAISMLIGAISFLPGGLGSAEATMISLLLLKGVDTATALAITIFIRLTTLWFAVFLGLYALIKQRHLLKSHEIRYE